MEESKYKVYDSVFSTVITNAIHASVRCGGLALSNFCETNKDHLLFYEASKIFVQTQNQKVSLQMSWFKYIVFRIKHWKERSCFKKYSKNDGIELTKIEPILEFMIKELNLEPNIFGEIYDAYFNVTE